MTGGGKMNAKLKKGVPILVTKVLTNQSLEVDAVSGATLTSNTVLKAIENALEEKQ